MKSRYLAVCVVFIALVAPALFADSKSGLRPGKWQISTQMEIPGMPFKMPAVKHTQCITQKQLESDPQASIPKDDKSDCKVSNYKKDGNTISWNVECPKSKTTGSGEITVDGDSYTGKMEMKSGDTEMSAKYSAKRLGDCTE